MVGLVKPLLIGAMLAMVLSVPRGYIEKHLFHKNPTAILLSLILVIGMLLGVSAASAAYALLKEATQKREAHSMQSKVQ